MQLVDAFIKENSRTNKKLGQHFLIDGNIIAKIIKLTNDIASSNGTVTSKINIIEIGPGCGVLTEQFAKLGYNIVAIEKDNIAYDFITRHLFFYDNLKFINSDFLGFTFNNFTDADKDKTFIVSNLPYNNAKLIMKHLTKFRGKFSKTVFMVQEEQALKLTASPSSKFYGTYSAFFQLFYKISKKFNVQGSCFQPKTKVTSSVITFEQKDVPLQSEQIEDYFNFIISCFANKRKTIKNNLQLAIQNNNNQDVDIDVILKELNVNASSRPENIDSETYLKIYEKIK